MKKSSPSLNFFFFEEKKIFAKDVLTYADLIIFNHYIYVSLYKYKLIHLVSILRKTGLVYRKKKGEDKMKFTMTEGIMLG
jgi:hypothetical protein